MTVHDDLDRLLSLWLDETAGAGAPDYLDEALADIASIRQRPAWLSPGRWLHMQLTMPRVAMPRVVPLIVLALLIAALLVVVLLVGGRQRVPPPFGPAVTGKFVYDSAGKLFVADADGTNVRLLLDAPNDVFGATWSRDGRRLALWSRTGPDAAALWIVDADGANAHQIGEDVSPGPDPVFPAVDWSPAGDVLAFSAGGHLFLVDVDGRRLREVKGANPSVRDGPAWSPAGTLVAYHLQAPSGETGVYVVGADGLGEQRVSQAVGAGNSHLLPSWSPDGRALTYHTGDLNFDIAVARQTATGWTERIVVDDPLDASWPRFSNDGDRLSFVLTNASNTGSLIVADLEGAHRQRLESEPVTWAPHCWTPDDRSIIAVTGLPNVEIGKEPNPGFVVVSVEGMRPPVLIPTPERAAFAACSWQRLAP